MGYLDIKHNKIVRQYHDAIIKLVEENPINKISIQMILDETQTSRRTFYKYFVDKFALMNYVYYHDMKEHYIRYESNLLKSSETPLKINLEDSKNIYYEKKAYYAKLFKYEGQNSFCDFHEKLWTAFFQEIIPDYLGEGVYNTESDYTVKAYINGLFKITKEWLLSDCTSMTPEEMANVTYKYMTEEMKMTREKHIQKAKERSTLTRKFLCVMFFGLLSFLASF